MDIYNVRTMKNIEEAIPVTTPGTRIDLFETEFLIKKTAAIRLLMSQRTMN